MIESLLDYTILIIEIIMLVIIISIPYMTIKRELNNTVWRFRFVYRKAMALADENNKYTTNIMFKEGWEILKNQIHIYNTSLMKLTKKSIISLCFVILMFVLVLTKQYWSGEKEIIKPYSLLLMLLYFTLFWIFLYFIIIVVFYTPIKKIDEVDKIIKLWKFVQNSLCFHKEYLVREKKFDQRKVYMYIKKTNKKHYLKTKVVMNQYYENFKKNEASFAINYLIIWGFHLSQKNVYLQNYEKEYQNFIGWYAEEINTWIAKNKISIN